MHQTLDDGDAQRLSQAWSDLSLTLIDELHAIAAGNLKSLADAAKHGLEQVQKSIPPTSINGETTGRGLSPWLIGAAIGVFVILLPRWR